MALAATVIAGTSVARGDDEAACGARVRAVFTERAPRDRFELTNRSSDDWIVTRLRLDLDGSAGRLLFDTEAGGDGVEVFQPLRIETDTVGVREIDRPADGQAWLALHFTSPEPDTSTANPGDTFVTGRSLIFSIDVDDRLDRSDLGQIRVSGAEIEGARLDVDVAHVDGSRRTLSGHFGDDARVELVDPPCPTR